MIGLYYNQEKTLMKGEKMMLKSFKQVVRVGLCMLLVLGIDGCKTEEKNPEEDVIKVEPYTKGKVEGNHYENSWLNLQADFSDEIYIVEEEQILQAQRVGSHALYENKKQEDLEKVNKNGVVTYEVMAMYMTGSPNCSLVVEKLPFTTMTEKIYLEATKKNILAGTNAGVQIIISDTTSTIQLGDKTFTGIKCTISANGRTVESEVYVRIQNGHAIVFNVTYDENTKDLKDSLIEAFKPLN